MNGFTVTSKVDSIAIGNFDGMHVGHKALFENLTRNGAVCVIEHFRATLTPHIYRARFTKSPLFFYDFEKIKDLNPKEFVDRLMFDFPSLTRIVVGEDFRFGYGRSGDVSTLKTLFGGDVVAVNEVKVDGEGVHSRFIREYIREGKIEKANKMLGHAYEVWGDVIKGQGIGKESLVATLNLCTGRFLLPKPGVYKSSTYVDGAWHRSVTFVGHRESTDGEFAVETHIIGKDLKDVVGKVGIRWHSYLRANRAFGSLKELKEAIEKDIEAASEER